MTQRTTQQTIQQERAASAWAQVATLVGQLSAKEYGSLVKGLPAMIQTNGLAPTLAFLLAKGKSEHVAAYNHLSTWVMRRIQPDAPGRLMEYLVQADSRAYRRAAAEAQAYLVWLKRFAEANNLGD